MQHHPEAERWLSRHPKKPELNLRHYGTYNRQGRVYAIARPDAKPVCPFPKKTFAGRAEVESFVNELVFLKYSPKGTWFWILKDNDFLTDRDLSRGTLNGQPRTPELSRDHIIDLIAQGKLAVFPLNEYIPPEDRTHHLPRAKRPKGADEPVPAGGPGDRVVPLAPETKPEPLPKPGTYATQDEAAKAALTVANPKSIADNKEYGGLIYRDSGGRYGYTGPVSGDSNSIDPHNAPVPAGARSVGDYHTHADYSVFDKKSGEIVKTGDPTKDDFNSDNFSPQDYRGIRADAKGRGDYKGYLGTPSGKFKVFDPASGTVSELR